MSSVVRANGRRRLRIKLVRLGLAGASVVGVLGVLEVGLRATGGVPGYVPGASFKPVRTLMVSDRFQTDDEGVFKANPAARWGAGSRVNDQGFRGAELQADPSRRSVLFLGDSFTWGASALPLTSSFADRVERAGYLVFNTGIPGTGPNQYEFLAKKYVPTLRPNFVAVMLYLGNDLGRPNPMRPGESLYYWTNAGVILAYDEEGHHLKPGEAYRRAIDRTNMVDASAPAPPIIRGIRGLLLKTVVGSHLWSGLSRPRRVVAGLKMRLTGTSNLGTPHEDMDPASARRALLSIRAVARENASEFLLFAIPMPPDRVADYLRLEALTAVFDGFEVLMPDNLEVRDYEAGRGQHLNNRGHAKFAEFILQELGKRER